MLMIGIGLEVRLDGARYGRAARYLSLRYAISTVLALGAWQLPLPHDFRLLLVMVLLAPIASMAPGYTSVIRGDVTLGTFMTSVSIRVGIVAMPTLLVLLG